MNQIKSELHRAFIPENSRDFCTKTKIAKNATHHGYLNNHLGIQKNNLTNGPNFTLNFIQCN